MKYRNQLSIDPRGALTKYVKKDNYKTEDWFKSQQIHKNIEKVLIHEKTHLKHLKIKLKNFCKKGSKATVRVNLMGIGLLQSLF
jgi:hypothetical protein